MEAMNSNYRMTYNIDLVFCIDQTGSMDHIIDTVKNNALRLYQDIVAEMELKHKKIGNMRIRAIGFRDYIEDGEEAMSMSDFFKLPDEAVHFKECIELFNAHGGGDIPEDGLEALAYAIRSPWQSEGIKKRHIIVVWSDADTHPLGFGKSSPAYPQRMAKDFTELTEWWGDKQHSGYMDQRAKRLLLFAPDTANDKKSSHDTSWKTIATTWENTMLVPSVSQSGLQEVEYKAIVSQIVNTI